MNKLRGHISLVVSHGNLSRVVVSVSENLDLQAVVIDKPGTADYLKEGSAVKLIFKETEVILCQAGSPLMSVANRISGIVSQVQEGKILSRIDVKWDGGSISAIADTKAIEAMSLEKGIHLLMVIPFNQIMLQPA
jgi:molybdopterin-binding protein